jgi:hypothetical protein
MDKPLSGIVSKAKRFVLVFGWLGCVLGGAAQAQPELLKLAVALSLTGVGDFYAIM